MISHKSRRPLKSIAAAKILGGGDSIDEGKTTRDTINMVIGNSLDLTVVTDSKDLYTFLSTKRNSVDRSICADANIITYEYETGSIDSVVWIRSSTNHAKEATKKDSALTEPLRLMLHSRIIPFHFSNAKYRFTNRTFG